MKVFENFNLTNYNSYKIESYCSKAYFPESENDFLKIFKQHNLKEFVLIGNGNNIILSKSEYERPFIILNENFKEINVDKTLIEAESGATALEISSVALKHSLTGVEFLYDIPSSVGGAVIMNAGTKEGETKDVLYKVRYLDLSDLIIKERFSEEIGLSYRNSFFQNNTGCIILKAWFKLRKGNNEHIEKLMIDSKNRRWSIQPRDYPNCGSVFKRPPGKFVGPMLDELGLKGFSVGGAKVSEKHSGFIINFNRATGQNILDLISEVKNRVKDKFGIILEVEQRII
ncbi:UDP-N-acetylmuramate dehydrogenase [Algoriphagus marinus]|uniref:UDP-N-acetylmuramate dehydrogenase n=1 Tax=Algoriphagus marinus TaxID=1925762 RepID=UPI00094BB1D0|nr:UDP-N-acetylmuramate dehydrogenase [Algoriphagus marinus]